MMDLRNWTVKSIPLMKSLWSDTIAAVKGSEQDYTQGNVGRAIFLLSLPMVLEMAMESVFAITDIFFVSKLGAEAVATVGITESVLTLIYAIAEGLSMATIAVIARRIGEKEVDKASLSAVQAILIGLIVSIPVAVLGVLYSDKLLQLMGASPQLIVTGYLYPTILIGANGIIMLLFIINAIFRGAGDAAIAMRVLWIANLINIILDPCLIFGLGPFPELGLVGAAVATTIGRGIGLLYQLYALRKGTGRIRITARHIKPDIKIIKRLIQVSIGGVAQFLIATASWIGLTRIVAVFGSGALAGYTIAIRIIIFSILPSWGLSNAAATLVGQNLGAKEPGRAERSVWIAALINMFFLGAVAVFFISQSEFLVRLFSSETDVITSGARCLYYISFGYLFYAYGMVMIQAFNGAGDTRTPTIINFFCFWLLEIPLAYYLSLHTNLAEAGVFISIVVAESLVGIVGIILFRRGTWKTRQV
jgi:putative MATE family efflux protein